MSLPHKAYDYLIVGSSLYGSTFAHFAHKQGKRCLEWRHLHIPLFLEKVYYDDIKIRLVALIIAKTAVFLDQTVYNYLLDRLLKDGFTGGEMGLRHEDRTLNAS